jgi:hypothetical protein
MSASWATAAPEAQRIIRQRAASVFNFSAPNGRATFVRAGIYRV